MQKSLQGLDNTTPEGTEAIDNFTDVFKTLGDHGLEATWVKNAEQKIKEAKTYLKTEFKSHVGREETCADHCAAHALGDTNLQSTCQREQCESLETILKEIESEINRVEMPEEHKLWLNHNFKLCLAYIQDWKAHLLRTVNQEKRKQLALEHVDSASCLIVMDWAMKYLPQRYSENEDEAGM